MYSRKILQNKCFISDNKNKAFSQSYKEITISRNRSATIGFLKNIAGKKFFYKNQEIQDNSIIEEDDYNFEVYNYPIVKDENFLIVDNNNEKFNTIPVPNLYHSVNKNSLKLNSHRDTNNNNNNNSNNNSRIYCTNSTEVNYNYNLTIKTEKNNDENGDNIISNINIFKMIHKERKNVKFINNVWFRDDKIEKSITEFQCNKNFFSNKYSKKNRKKLSLKTYNGIIRKHDKKPSGHFTGPYLRKNKISQINHIKNVNINKIISNRKPKYTINLKDDEVNSRNMTKIHTLKKNLFSQIDTNYEKRINTTNEEDKLNIFRNSLYDLKKNHFMEECDNGCVCQKENNYIFNLKFFNIYNNNENDNNKDNSKSRSKSKTRSMYVSKDNTFDEKNSNITKISQKNSPKLEKKKSKKNIFKRRVIFEEEYIIDSNGNQRFLCVKRINDDDEKKHYKQIGRNNYFNTEANVDKKNYVTNNFLTSLKSKKSHKKIDLNIKVNNNRKKILEGTLLQQKIKEKKIESKTVLNSPQISYENIFSKNHSLKSQIKLLDNKRYKKIPYYPKNKKNSKVNNFNTSKEKSNILNSRSSIIKFIENNQYQKRNNYSLKNLISINKVITQNNKDINEKSKFGRIIKERPILSRKQILNNYKVLNTQTINNSRNYNSLKLNNTNINSNKNEHIDLNYTVFDKINEKKEIYNNAYNFDNNNNIYFNSRNKLIKKLERNNYKFHEIKSVSKERLITDNKLNLKKSLNHFYFESNNQYKRFANCISMDNIKLLRNDNIKFKFHTNERLKKSSKKINTKNMSVSNKKNIHVHL